jgi:GT2 family glycosyltransferase
MIYIVIPVFNRKKFTRECLESLRIQSFKEFKTIVVDDGSTDGTGEMLRTEFPEVIVLNGDGNLFWTASTNMGIRYALEQGAGLIMTLNNDTTAPGNFLEKMMHWSQQEPEALLGALGVDAVSKKPYYGGELVNWKRGSGTYLLDVLKEEERKGLHKVSLFPGRGLLIPRKVFDTIGLFDEKTFPHYAADYDFTLSAGRHGFKIFCNYDAWINMYPEETGTLVNTKSKSPGRYLNHLFGIKGGGNLRNYTIYVMRHCPKTEIPLALLVGYIRRLGGYWMK